MATEVTTCPHCHQEIISQNKVYQDDYIYIDPDGFVVELLGVRVHLTATEYRLLSCLVHNSPRILTHRQILLSVWGFEYQDDVDFIRMYVWHLRRKIESEPAKPRYIIASNGLGYYFNDTQGRYRP